MIILFESLDEFLSATKGFILFHDPKRGKLFTYDVSNHFLIYKPKNDEEVKKVKSWRIVIAARLLPTISPDSIESFSKLYDEFKEDVKKIVGKKIVDAKIGDDGIDLVFEDGTTLEIYCFGAWAWSIDKEDQTKKTMTI